MKGQEPREHDPLKKPVDCSRTIVLCNKNQGETEKETDAEDAFSNDDDVSRSDWHHQAVD